MAKILITSGPTRQYIDPVRYLTNASSGRMGAALAAAALELGHEVVIVSGPVEVEYPEGATVVPITSTEELMEVAREQFASCDGLIGAAAPCDYRPKRVEDHKIHKTGEPLLLELVETDDVVATLGAEKDLDPEDKRRWVVGFALETEDHRLRALAKLERKHCDLMVSNGVEAMNARENTVEILCPEGDVLAQFSGSKTDVARGVLRLVDERLVRRNR
ncbi:phosphopantothenoylcysteine decarboxylase [Aeoliella sp.]|uniref:phosphopantothenoylcysteine decarboxylase domain-containing protein n=1 Tax=Aeoliella sp. TaxID=2795800 RepID=UPI003CCB8D72